ncbi:hypothetical protein PTKIN_Ptkin17bG0002900 [Pterospermum kingtungense]
MFLSPLRFWSITSHAPKKKKKAKKQKTMMWDSSENMLCWDKKKAMEELGRGRELTNQLRHLLTTKPKSQSCLGLGHDEGSVVVGRSEEDLVIKIFNSFANTISMLRNTTTSTGCSDYGDHDEVSQQINPRNNNTSSEDFGDSIKTTTTTQTKGRRGCYKRRKGAESWTKDTSALFDDGHAWRKYGQKQILNANHPRNYFRCTHKTDQGCPATKQVQKIGDDPPVYRTTYYGHHTCKNMLNTSHIIMDSTPNDSNSILLSFENNNLTNSSFFSSFQSSIKQETKEEHKPSSTTVISYNPYLSSSSSEYLLSPDHHMRTSGSSSAQMTVLSADHTDGVSGVVDPVDLHDLLDF